MSTLVASLDLDDSWAYLRARNDPAWRQAPSVIELAANRTIDLLDAAGIPDATVFVVGADARRTEGVAAVRACLERGLEIADHSYWHRGELASRPREEIARDLTASGAALAELTGERPLGFRCPSFGASADLTATLSSLGYAYDASPLPTTLVPLLRAYHRVAAGAGDHTPTYGTMRTAFGPLRPHQRDGLLAVPTTTLPGVRTPIHGSYLCALAGISVAAASAYARIADTACRLFGLPVSFLLHPTDVLDQSDAPQLAFFPGMAVPWTTKRAVLREALRRFAENRETVRIAALTSRRRGGAACRPR